MARGEQLGRQWKLIQTLLSAHTGKSATTLARELAYHPRTVYRDLEALQLAGFPLYTERVDGRSLWSCLETFKNQIPIPLNFAELMALYFSRDMLKILKNTVFYDSLESFFQKVKATLPPEYINYLGQIETTLRVGQKPYKEYGRFQETLNALSEAVLHRKYVSIDYFAMSRKKKSRRKVAPYKIWFFDGAFYLIAHCTLRHDIRLFAIDRIQSFKVGDENFQIPDDFSSEDFMHSSFGVFVGKPTTVKIRFAAYIAGYIRERVWHATQEIESLSNGDIILKVTVAGTDEIKFWVLSWGAGATVLKPESLRNEIKNEAEAMLHAYTVE